MEIAARTTSQACAYDKDTWFEDDSVASAFKDARLKRRFLALLKSIAGTVGGSIPFVCRDWGNTKAAYRVLSNERVSEADILAGHFRESLNNSILRPSLIGRDSLSVERTFS
jgi:hypothetical protein